MGNVHEDYKKEAYAIPLFTVGGSTRTDTVSTGGSVGNVIKIMSGSDTLTFTLWGTRASSTGLFSETIAVTATSYGVSTVTTDWLYNFGVCMNDKYGLTPSTETADTYFYAVSTSGNEVALISSSEKSDKAQIFELTGKNVTVHDVSGNLYLTTKLPLSGTTIVMPSSNNAFRLTAGMVSDDRVRSHILMDSDTGGATVQIKVWED